VIWLQYAGATVFALLGLIFVVLTPIGVPGAWMLIGVAGSVDVTVMLAGGSSMPYGLTALAVAVAAATLGELLEFVAASLGARAGGASRSGMVGSVVGALVGVAAGAVIGETAFHGRSAGDAMRPATGAVIGRVIGSLAKLPCALVAWMALVVDAFT
jgi:uncharacterized protein YqgC (DUF456 family)